MADILITGGGGGIASSEDTTAQSPQVLENYTYLGADTDDDVGTGTMKHLTNRATIGHATDNATKVIPGDQAYISTNTDGTNRFEIRYNSDPGYITANTLFGIPTATAASVGQLTAAKLMQGQSAFGLSGTATSDATAIAAYIRQGYTAYVKGQKITGVMTVGSVVSFSVAAYSTDQVIATWKWPSKGPYSGVAICAKTGGYPTSSSDSRVYTGTGSSSAVGSTSTAIISNLSVGTTYYFRIWVYCTCSAGDLWSGYSQATCTTTSRGQQTFTSSGTFTVPANVRKIQCFVVGGGGGGGSGNGNNGGGAGGGFTKTGTYNVTPGQQLAVTIGAGGVGGKGEDGASGGDWPNGKPGGATSIGNLITANGGNGGVEVGPGSGGSGGGESDIDSNYAGNGGSDGSPGYHNGTSRYNSNNDPFESWYGQGTTTRAFGESSGTLYAGGGGGASSASSYGRRGFGGEGGGGNGRYESGSAEAGDPNTGGGAGGTRYQGQAPTGGSGIAIIRWGY